MANDARGSLLERHRLLLKALRDPDTSKGDCAVLGAISEHADADGKGWPGVALLAGKLGIARTTVMRSVARMEARGYLEVDRKVGLSNRYRLAGTGSADATGTGSVDATGTSSADATSSQVEPVAPTHHTGSVDATRPVAPMRRDQSHRCDPNSVQELSSKNSAQGTQGDGSVKKVTKAKSEMITFQTYLATVPEGQLPVPAKDPIFDYAEDVGMPRAILKLHWYVFSDKYRNNPKRYRDWLAVLRNSVRANWYKLWWIDDTRTFQLTTTGKQADLEYNLGIQQNLEQHRDPGRMPRLVA
jgi:hypothetical protein